MLEKLFVLRNLPFSISNIAPFAYFIVFIILLRIRSIKLSKTWFVPFFAIYFGLMFATLFGIFLNGAASSLSENDHFVSIIRDLVNPKNGRGQVMYGGYIGSIVGILIANCISRHKPLSELFDVSAISISLVFTIWRTSCFVGGCCYGIPNETFGVSFPNGASAFRHLEGTSLVVGNATVPLLPTQLFSFVGDFTIFLFLLIFFCKNKTRYPYFYFFAHALLYGIGRFTIEFFRIDPREFWGHLSMSQWISLMLVAAALVFFIKNRKEIAESFKNPSRNY